MKEINQSHVTRIIDLINASPYFSLLSMKVTHIGISYSNLEMSIEEKHFNPFGGIHGGVYSSLIDTAAYWSVYCELPENSGMVTVDLTVNNLGTVKSGKLFVEGKRIKVGKTICLAEARILDESGKIISHGISKMMILKEKQTIEHIMNTSGAVSLPGKFL